MKTYREIFQSGRRLVYFDRIKGAAPVTATLIGTSFGLGLAPFAPGSFGTLLGVPIHFITYDWNLWARVLIWAVLFAAGCWACTVFDQLMGTGDNQNLVMDETVGYGITAWTAGGNWKSMLAAFVIFRIFDVIKPPPVRQVDTFSKIQSKKNKWWGGFGVMADDAAAAILGLIVMLILQHYAILP